MKDFEQLSTEYSSSLEMRDKFVDVSNDQEFLTIELTNDNVKEFINYHIIKEKFFNNGINNLIKKNEFLQLYIQLIEEQLTEEEFEKELEENEEKYSINIEELTSEKEVFPLIRILKSLPKQLSIDQVSEIFGINFWPYLNKLNKT